jgi:hypothetical protein
MVLRQTSVMEVVIFRSLTSRCSLEEQISTCSRSKFNERTIEVFWKVPVSTTK